MPKERYVAEATPNSIPASCLSCPVCDGILAPLLGDLAVEVLERHLERDHWYPLQLAHEAATAAFNNKIQ